jgi:hypothetical protein
MSAIQSRMASNSKGASQRSAKPISVDPKARLRAHKGDAASVKVVAM